MAEQSSSPFDWLQGGLFFGKSSGKGGIEVIDSCKDAATLINGLNESLTQILSAPPSEKRNESSGSLANENPKKNPSPSDYLAARLARLRYLLYNERQKTSSEPTARRTNNPTIASNMAKEFTRKEMQDLIPKLLENLTALPFESRKHVAAIFNYLLVCGLDGNDASVYESSMALLRDYVADRFEQIMMIVVNGHSESESVLHFGSMYRSCLKHPKLYAQLVASPERTQRFIYPFLDSFVQNPNFEISSDAMESVRSALGANSQSPAMAPLAAEFLARDYEPILEERFNGKLLVGSAGYMTHRVALQILSTVLLTRSNYGIMIRYVASRQNLILVMKLLRDTSPHITLDAFHVFKVFVANPNKPDDVVKILQDNKVKLCAYLKTLHQEKEDSDTQFRDEKALIISTIEAL